MVVLALPALDKELGALGFTGIDWHGSRLWIHPDTKHWIMKKGQTFELSKMVQDEFVVIGNYSQNNLLNELKSIAKLWFRRDSKLICPAADQAVAL